ncbi:tetratricopeptide repeat protein [Polynucleobacter alcilacus]|uniref:tetratricopeptide repeat protein n=1 Tax=Polynucleobacter alcilacus TaxID=1819739 RepID=UPI001C0D07C2|nr:tetratricopeptide repeat protein [Polynucleobacter alcilacus]MBU3568564.1 DUF560 domain-containing protein [Polynucleobacter alcilacus]
MFKKPLSSLQHVRPQQLTHVFAAEIDSRLNQGAFFILEQLVQGGESLTQAVLKGSTLALPLSRSVRRQLKRRYFRFRYRYLPQQKLEAVLASLANPQLELNPRAMDLALQALCLAIMQGIITNTEHSILYLREAYIGLLEFWHDAIDWQMHEQGMKQVWQQSQRFVEQQCNQWQETVRKTMEMPRVQYLYALAKPLTKPSIYASILTLVVISATSNADVADEMKVLIEQKKAGEAYVLGSKHPELMGDPLFDYFYGVAAVEVGHPTEGVLALERVLLNDPNNDLVRLELARAYYAQGDYQRAKDEFLAVKKSQPPTGVISTINVYLDDIKSKEGAFKTTYGVYVELGMGYNNNVNAATAVSNIVLPYIGPVTLGSTSQPLKSAFGYDMVGANIAVPITGDVSVFANANTSAQRYSQVNGYDLNVTNATTGVKVTDGLNTYKIAGFGSFAQVDQVPVPNTYGGGGEYIRQLSATDSVMIAGGSTVLQYPSQFNAYNSNLNVGTVGYRTAFPDRKWQPVLDLSANMAHQIDTSNRPDLGRRIAGAALQLSFLPAEKLGVTIGAGYAKSKYDSNDLLYQTNRVDNLYSGNAVLQYKLTKELSARMEITYYNNLSNLNLYGYEQWTGAIKLRYDWNSN